MYEIGRRSFRKVPEITIFFWIVKLLTTAMGESTSDFLVFKINPYFAVLIGAIALAISLLWQFKVHKYIAVVYWLAVAMVAVFGTMAADALHKQLGVPYVISTIFFAITLAVVFIAWYKTEHTLSIHSINTACREMFYWAAVLATFALGTAAGDMTANTLGLGYFTSALLFGGLIVIPAIAYWLGLNSILAFWTAYVLTRPLGASLADWMGKLRNVGGLGWGDGHVAVGLTIFIVIFVGYLAVTRLDVKSG
jgi:uncharacterized membrane-anchored protein